MLEKLKDALRKLGLMKQKSLFDKKAWESYFLDLDLNLRHENPLKKAPKKKVVAKKKAPVKKKVAKKKVKK